MGGLTDETLDFGTLRMGRGSVFALDAPMSRMSGTPVFKSWITDPITHRRYLFESVRWKSIRKELEQLGALQAALPLGRENKISQLALLREAVPPREVPSPPVQVVLDAQTFDHRQGLVLDYVLCTGNSTNITFQADTTYLISGPNHFWGTTIFEGNTVLKYTATNDAIVQISGPVIFQTDHYRPAIFTSRQDRTVGEDLYLAGAPTNYSGALYTETPDQEFKHLRISYATNGLYTYTMKLRHAQFVHCDVAVITDFSMIIGDYGFGTNSTELDNILIYDVRRAFSGLDYSNIVRHATVHNCSELTRDNGAGFDIPSVLLFANSLLANVTNRGNATNLVFDSATVTNGSDSSFQVVGAGGHYLIGGSTNRNAGTMNLPATLLADLALRTTYPPTVYTNTNFTTSLTLSIQAPRCTNLPDLGWHYAPLDYAFGSNSLSIATLRIPAGVVLGTFTPGSNTHGLLLQLGSQIVGSGDPTNLARIVRYNIAQEQADDTWSAQYPGAQVRVSASNAGSVSGSFRFTDWSVPDHGAAQLDLPATNFAAFAFRDCQFTGGKIYSHGPVAFTNCLFNRVISYCEEYPIQIINRWYNNTFFGGTLTFYNSSSGHWEIYNNAFYNTADLTTDAGGLNQDWNAYLPGAPIINHIDTNHSIITNIVFVTGTLGDFYLTNNSPLINRGTNTAADYGLYWYTTAANQTVESNSTVDIGFHYIALGSTNFGATALDTDGDGLANWFEDQNGNGTQDTNENSVVLPDNAFVVHYEPLGPSSRRTPLIISEIMYFPALNNGPDKFVELYNTSHLTQSLAGFTLVNPDGPVYYFTGSVSTVLAPGAFTSIQVISLSRKQTIQLRNAQGAVLLEVKYDHKQPWPKAADGPAHSLVLARPSYGEGDPRAWEASARIGGSRGYAETDRFDPLRPIRINEFLANGTNSNDKDFIELYNACNYPVDISGCYLANSVFLTDFRIPNGTVLPARGFKLYRKDDPGSFTNGLAASGDQIFLTNPDLSRVIDAVEFEAQDAGVTRGRWPDGAPTFSELSIRTLGGTNAVPLTREIVINEIMYNPISGTNADDYIEIYNRGSATQSLSGWHFDGVTFSGFGSMSILPSNFIVIAASTNSLLARFPGRFTNGVSLAGQYAGDLANSGERIALLNSNDVVIDEVTYSDGGRWGKWSDGGGSGLELIDPRSDNRLAANWADSDESTKAGTNWTLVTVSNVTDWGLLSNFTNNLPRFDALEIILAGAGECLIDNVEVTQGTNQYNYVTNSTFEIGLGGWSFLGTHSQCSLEPSNGFGGGQCLHLRTATRGDPYNNSVRFAFTNTVASNATVVISARVLWLTGNRDIVFRLKGNALEAAGTNYVPSNLGTPGLVNSRFKANNGPAISDVSHEPVVPAANTPVRVTARVNDPDGVSQVVLQYRTDPATNMTTVTMRDDGTQGDALAGDGLYSGVITGQVAGTMIAFYVQAADANAAPATNRFPSDAPARECLVRFGDPAPTGPGLGTYRLWMTQLTASNWAFRGGSDNTPLDITLVYADQRIVYDAGGLYNDSPFHVNEFNGPTNKLCAYAIKLPEDDPLLGETDFTLDFAREDSTAQRQQATYWLAGELGLPHYHRRFVNVIANGMLAGARAVVATNKTTGEWIGANIYEDIEQPNRDVIAAWQPNDADGQLYKVDLMEEPTFANENATLETFLTTGGIKKTARYRWHWRKRGGSGSDSDYAALFALVDAVNTTSNYTSTVEGFVDAERWMRTLAFERIVGSQDSYGWGLGHNMYAYKGADLWELYIWDMDFTWGGPNQRPPTDPLFGGLDPVIDQMVANPPFRRMFWRTIYDALNGPFTAASVSPIFDGNYTFLSTNYFVTHSNSATLLSPDQSRGAVPDLLPALRDWVTNRYNFLTGQLASVSSPFEISNNGGNNFTTNQSNVVLFGKAPVEVASIRLNGASTNLPLTWSSVTNWSATLTLTNGANALTNRGYDRLGAFLTNAIDSITITNQP